MRPLLLALTLSLPLALACKGAEGDTCKEDNDCTSGLLCCGGDMFGRGTCEMSCDVPTDSGPPVDTGAVDAAADVISDDAMSDVGADDAAVDASDVGPDDAGPDDAGPDDAGPDDAGPDDAGPDDVGPDTAPPADAGDDAGT